MLRGALAVACVVFVAANSISGFHGYFTHPNPDATVTGHFIDADGRGCWMVIEYEVDGETYRIDQSTGRHTCRDGYAGERVEVSYESDDPARAYAQGDTRWVELGGGLIFGTPLVALCALGARRALRVSRRKARGSDASEHCP